MACVVVVLTQIKFASYFFVQFFPVVLISVVAFAVAELA